ncbi:MAG: toll/interleukin-1 receptor domain-containing protein, partial [Thermodesulfobacteriota bacterium]
MNDIFISYKNSDKERVRVLVEALEGQGWSVWWDREIPPGKTFDQVIEEHLNAARCVIVVWSEDSVLSEWVKTESSEAAQRGVLVPVLIDDVKIPLEFRRIQAAWLVDWQGKLPHEGFEQLSEAVAGILGPSTLLKQEQDEHVDGRENDFEKKVKEEPPTIVHEDSSEVSPKKRTAEDTQTRYKPLLVPGVAIIGLVIVAIIAYKVLFAAKFPTIDYFNASPEVIEPGEKTTLNWKTSNTKQAEIIGLGKVPLSGTETVSPSETTAYTLIAENEEGKGIKGTLTVEVKAAIPPPEISYFKASPSSIAKGDSSTLSWETSNTKEVEITGIGKVPISGDEKVSPPETTAYTIIAKNERGTAVQGEVAVAVG